MNKILKEKWKNIKDFEGLYQVSDLGRIKSLIGNTKILKPSKNKRGYIVVKLCKNHLTKQYYVHRLVATHFIDNPLNKNQVNHKDGNKTNNNLTNLEWCTESENVKHAYETGLTLGVGKPVTQFDLEGNFIKLWKTQSEASKSLKICEPHISNCCNNKNRTAGGYIWKYPDQF